MVDSKKYVVLDVETNGLDAKKHDLLSIALYRPDTDYGLEIFLPLTKNDEIYTNDINGITKEMLKGKKHLTNQDIQRLIHNFDLNNRTILTYSGNGFDERFIQQYFTDHHLDGFESFHFFDFKQRILSNRFESNASKDELCEDIGIEGVNDIHSAINDCKLEWQLYNKMNEQFLYIDYNNNSYLLNPEYYIPASNIKSYSNMNYYHSYASPKISLKKVKDFTISVAHEQFYEAWIMGQIMEAIVNYKVNAIDLGKDSYEFQKQNKKNLTLLSVDPTFTPYEEIVVNPDGSIDAPGLGFFKKRRFNKMVKNIEDNTNELSDYIQNSIFHNDQITTQEIVLNHEDHVLSRCDLSNQHSVLEIKTTSGKLYKYNSQIYYESNHRNAYFLQIDLSDCHEITYTIYQAFFK